ncbi:MAG: GNAT family N-acetyltransferase [Gaiellaceae bacterium]
MYQQMRSESARHFPRESTYEGSAGTAWCAGFEERAPSIAAFFCGDDVRLSRRGYIWRDRVPNRITGIADAGGLPMVRVLEPERWPADVLRRAIVVPQLVDLHMHVPADVEVLRAQLLTSTTREDFRRIRRANFSYRVTRDPDVIREFHTRHYAPLVADRFPEDGTIIPAWNMLDRLNQGGELICADIDGTWVAGIFNLADPESYHLGALGIRDADDAVRQKRVVAALVIRSLERAVELGRARVGLGRSLPFLGKGPVWFKAKWGGILTRGADIEDLHMFMDIRRTAVRRMLSASPIIHAEGDALVVSTWLEPGDKPLQETTRDAGRFPGISRWHVLAEPETLAAAGAQLSANERIVPIPVALRRDDGALWLGEALPSPAVST